MTALARDRRPPMIKGLLYTMPVAADVKIYEGALLVVDSNGRVKPATTDTGLVAFGVADHHADNTDGAAGAITVLVRKGIWGFVNSAGGDEITSADIGQTVYMVDDQTVAKTTGGGTRSPAGAVRMIDQDGFVLVDIGMPSTIDGDLVASNNLSDVANIDTAAANIGANKFGLQLQIVDLVGANAAVYRVVSPVDGDIEAIYSVLEGAALATGNATLTAKIGAAAVTNGVVTITQAGSAVGDVDSATPTAAKTVQVGDVISITVGGTNTDTDATAHVTIYIETTA